MVKLALAPPALIALSLTAAALLGAALAHAGVGR